MTARRFRYGAGSLWPRAVVIVLLCAFLAQALAVATATSMTIDEGLHIASGLTIWRTGDYRLVEEHPPLTKLWMSQPLLVMPEIGDPTQQPAWQEAATPTTESLPLLRMAQQLLYPVEPVDRWLFPARAMVALLGMVLLAVVYRWARDLTDGTAALAPLALAAFDPNLIAHSAVAATDLGAATAMTLALWQATRFLRHPRWRSALTTGVLLGLALATKLTAMLLGPPLALAGMARFTTLSRRKRIVLLRRGFAVVGLAGLTLWAVYGFQVGSLPGTRMPVPAPAHIIPLMRLFAHSEEGHQAYLLGMNSNHGWWYYFPVAFLLKTPVPALLALTGGLAAALGRRGRGRRRAAQLLNTATSPPALFAVAYILTSLTSTLNIGYRHLLPLLPLAYIATAHLVCPARRRSRTPRIGQAALVVLILWQAGAALTHHPYPLSFFNVLAGGADDGWRYLADSNTDWGQGYKALADFQQAEQVGTVELAAFVFYDPALYGVEYTPLTPLGGDTPPIFPSRFAPQPGDYVISATPLDGIPTVDPAMYDWFRWRAPDALLANGALRYYRVTPEEHRTAWVAQCAVPVVPLDEAAQRAGFGDLPPRRITFDCTQGWLVPGGTLSAPEAGAYVLHGALVEDPLRARLHLTPPPVGDAFVARRLAAAEVVYRQRAYRSAPAFTVYRAAGATVPPPTWVWTAAAETPIGTALKGKQQTTPIPLQGTLTFLGVQVYAGDEGLDVETWWQVTGVPPTRPLSMMGHLLAASGESFGVADGLAVDPAQWQIGDVLVQRHRFEGVDAETPLLRTGVYWRDDGARWAVTGTTGADVILVRLGK